MCNDRNEINFRRLGVTEWSDPSGKLSRHFGPPLVRGTGTAPPPRSGGKTLVHCSCCVCGHPLQDLITHFLLDCPASEPLRCAIFGTTYDLWSRPLGRGPTVGSSIYDLWSRPLGRGPTVGSPWGSYMPPAPAPPPPK